MTRIVGREHIRQYVLMSPVPAVIVLKSQHRRKVHILRAKPQTCGIISITLRELGTSGTKR